MGQGGSQNPRTPTGAPGGANQPVLPADLLGTGGGEGVIKAIGNSGAATSLTLGGADGSVQTVLNTANCTYTMPSGMDSTKCAQLLLKVTNNGAFTATFTGVLWAGGVAPTLTSGAAKEDAFMFVTFDGGATWFGYILWQAAA